MKNLQVTLTDKYIIKQLLETFILGVMVFTALVFASDQFLSLIKQISAYGIPIKVAIITVLLQLPYIIVFTVPMGVLLATILTFNKLSTNSEITIMRACGISLGRLALPVLIFSFLTTILSFTVNEFVVPAANTQARNLMLWAITQKNIPEGKANFSFKELDENKQMKRLFYVSSCNNKKLEGVTVLDLSKQGVIQVMQAKYAEAKPEHWKFYNAVNYTISENGKIMNTAVFDESILNTSFNLSKIQSKHKATELNFFALSNYIKKMEKNSDSKTDMLRIMLHEKIALPVTSFLVALIGIPLAITPPRARVNRGLLFSIIVIFCYYVLRAVSSSLGEANILEPVLSAWMPNIIISVLGSYLLYRKTYLV